MGIIAGIGNFTTLTEAVKRWHCKIEMPAGNQLRHFLIEESDEQRCNMRTIDVSIRHDDDAVITQIIFTIILTCATTECLHQIADLLVGCQLVTTGAGHVEDFTA